METEFGEHKAPEKEPSKRGRGGRNPKEEDQRRINRIRSNATTDEYTRILAYYTDQKLGKQISIGQFMIDTVLRSAHHPTLRSSKPTTAIEKDVLRSLRIDLNSLKNTLGPIATNYNQSVKRINSLLVSAELKKEVGQANQLIAQLGPLLGSLTDLLNQLNTRLDESK